MDTLPRSSKLAAMGGVIVLAAIAAVVLWPRATGDRDKDWTAEPESSAVDRRTRVPGEGSDAEEHFMVLRARAAGLEKWQSVTTASGEGGQFLFAGGSADAQALADRLDTVVYIESGGRGGKRVRGGLSGLIVPGDTDAVSTLFLSTGMDVDGIDAVPPAAQLRDMAGLAALAVQLVSLTDAPAAASALLGTDDALAAHRATLESAAGSWPESARVWRVLAVPGEVESSQQLKFDYELDPEQFESEVRLARASGLRSFALIDNGALLATTVMRYQNAEQRDRSLYVDFIYDIDSDSWALLRVKSHLSPEDMMRLGKEGRFAEVNASVFVVEFTIAVPDCLITTRGLVRHGP